MPQYPVWGYWQHLRHKACQRNSTSCQRCIVKQGFLVFCKGTTQLLKEAETSPRPLHPPSLSVLWADADGFVSDLMWQTQTLRGSVSFRWNSDTPRRDYRLLYCMWWARNLSIWAAKRCWWMEPVGYEKWITARIIPVTLAIHSPRRFRAVGRRFGLKRCAILIICFTKRASNRPSVPLIEGNSDTADNRMTVTNLCM